MNWKTFHFNLRIASLSEIIIAFFYLRTVKTLRLAQKGNGNEGIPENDSNTTVRPRRKPSLNRTMMTVQGGLFCVSIYSCSDASL